MKRIVLILVASIALGLLPVASANAARRAIVPSAFEGSGDYDVTYDYNDDDVGPVLFFRQHFEWSLIKGGRSLALPKRGARTAKVPIQVHVISTGGGIFGDVPYTCTADRSYGTSARLRAKPAKSGWRMTLQSLTGLAPGPPACTDAIAGETFMWPTGPDWFASRLRDAFSYPRAGRRSRTIVLGQGRARDDCSDHPQIPLRCTGTIRWTGTLGLTRR